MYDGIAEPDPFEESYWNLMQTLAWVYLGDRTLVRCVADGAERGTFWQQLTLPDGRKEWAETQAPPPGPLKLAIIAADKKGAAYASFKHAKAALLAALRKGLVRVLGLANDRGDLQEISDHLWYDLKFEFHSPGEKHCAGPVDTFRADATRWYRLRFKREDVFKLWPDPFQILNLEEGNHEPPSLVFDLLPEGTIGLADAVMQYFEDRFPQHSKSIIQRDPPVGRFEREVWEEEASRRVPCNELAAAFNREWIRLFEVSQNVLLTALLGAKLVAKLETPDGKVRVVPASYWQTDAAKNWTIITGKLGPVGGLFESLNNYRHEPCFLKCAEFENWLEAQRGAPEREAIEVAGKSKSVPRNKIGRPPGAGSLESLDKPLVEKMHELKSATPSLSATQAAYKVVGEAAGGGTDESKVKRLTARYKQKFSETQQQFS
jgi:hypothetical protein